MGKYIFGFLIVTLGKKWNGHLLFLLNFYLNYADSFVMQKCISNTRVQIHSCQVLLRADLT